MLALVFQSKEIGEFYQKAYLITKISKLSQVLKNLMVIMFLIATMAVK
ncbi:hypothetical protein RINTHM_2850 [Richelia intracellularis HM01]|nr:hypothetical protein RINTHM_2850 [Richelia intracellularis HM01]